MKPRNHAGLREVLCQVDQLMLYMDEYLATPSLADVTILRAKVEQVRHVIRGLFKVYNL